MGDHTATNQVPPSLQRLPAPSTIQHYSLKEIFKLRDIQILRSCVVLCGENRPRAGDGPQRCDKIQVGEPASKQMSVFTYCVRRFWSTASVSCLSAFASVPSYWNTLPLALYRETLLAVSSLFPEVLLFF